MNREKYSDPTAELAISHVMKEQIKTKGGGESCQRPTKKKSQKPLNSTGKA